MNKLVTLLTALSIHFTGTAQTEGKVSGSIKDGGNQKVIDAATVSLLKASDSILVKAAVTNVDGNFIFEKVREGSYLVLATSIGHDKTYSAPFTVSAVQSDIKLGVLQLVAVTKSLKEVVVSSKKPFIERKVDRTVINVEASVTNAGSTAMEVLEKSPGVTIDKDGNISLKGKQGVLVLVDGKSTYMSPEDLANYLKNMPTSNLDQIEIMTTPPAKYDAAGNSGIINIKTKKNKQVGFNGSITSSYGQGKYARFNNSLNLNYRKDKINVFGSLTANQRKSFQDLYILRHNNNEDGTLRSIFEQNTNMLHNNQYYNGKVGFDYYATKKFTWGLVFSGYTAPEKEKGYSPIYLKDNTSKVDSMVVANSREDNSWKNLTANANMRYQFDSAGREITADIDYINYTSARNQHINNATYSAGGVFKYDEKLIGELPSDINIYSFKTDYTYPVNKTLKIESGLKTSYVETDNLAGYFNLIGDNKVPDYEKTNRFTYKENINAVYLNVNKEMKKWSVQVGLRVENTNYKGHQFGNEQKPEADSAFSKSYTGLFPTLYVGYNASEKNQYGFSYGRRINRPDYGDLNPFLFPLDKYTYGAGNPFLKPSYADRIELTHTFKQFFTTSLNYTHTKDLFTSTFRQNGDISTQSQGNFAGVDQVNLSFSAQVPVRKWWTMIAYVEGNYGKFAGDINGEYVNNSAYNYLVNTNNQFQFSKGWSAEVSGWYRSKGIEGQILIRPLAQVNAGIQKSVLKNKGTVKLSIRDIFYTQQEKGDIKVQNTDAYFAQKRDVRVANISFTYRFGKPIKGIQKRKTGGAGEEQNRVKSQG